MKGRYKVFAFTLIITILLAIGWTIFGADDRQDISTYLSAFILLCILAGPLCLIGIIISLVAKKKEWAMGLLFSTLFFVLLLLLAYLRMQESQNQ